MTAEILSIVSTCAFIVSGICFMLSLLFWFKFDIWGVMSDLSLKSIKKNIEKKRTENEEQKKPNNKITTKRKEYPKTGVLEIDSEESKNDIVKETDFYSNQTEDLMHVADVHNEHSLLDATVDFNRGTDVTGILDDTQDLDENSHRRIPKIQLTIIEEILMIHTNEVIEW